jgi:hypothetical protein
METKTKNSNLKSCIIDISDEDIIQIRGGGFAYDLGFFLREMFIYGKYGGGAGVIAASTDFAVYYNPAN